MALEEKVDGGFEKRKLMVALNLKVDDGLEGES